MNLSWHERSGGADVLCSWLGGGAAGACVRVDA